MTHPSAIIVSVEALTNSLVFGVHHFRFEEAWAQLGTILEFSSAPGEEGWRRVEGVRLWVADEAAILVRLSGDGRVRTACFLRATRLQEDSLTKVRRWLGL